MINFGGSNLSRSRSYPLIEILDLSSGSWAQLPPGDSDLPYLAKERWGHSATLIPKVCHLNFLAYDDRLKLFIYLGDGMALLNTMTCMLMI